MNRLKSLFLKTLIQTPDNIITSTWLKDRGISKQLQYKYRQSGLLQSIGRGACVKFPAGKVTFEEALHVLQQSGFRIHVGGYFALSLKGKTHYGKVKNTWSIFSSRDIKAPEWFLKYSFTDDWKHYKTNFLPENIGLEDFEVNQRIVKISSLERAAFELLYQTPKNESVQEAYEIFEFLMTLRPNLLQQLLENCKSIKVKRLFLYLSEKFSYSWFKYINLESIDLGSGVRVISRYGKFNKKYNIVIEERANE
jgi:hypothetical protein